MKLLKLKVRNFKKFDSYDFDFNDDINIIVGDNESGKSTVLEAIEMVLNCQYKGKPLSSELSIDLFNAECIERYCKSETKAQDELPVITIEAYIDGVPESKGINNSARDDSEGICLRIIFDEDLASSYKLFVEDPKAVNTLPVEFYKIEWMNFASSKLTHHNKQINTLFIDPTRIHPTYGKLKYINGILSSALTQNERHSLNLNYRQLKSLFDKEPEVARVNSNLDPTSDITDKTLKITADISSTKSWESGLKLSVDDIPLEQIGKGEQNKIQIKLALQKKAEDVHIVMIEELENHLSHINLVKLVEYINRKNIGKQVFLTTHSSYVLNKLSVNNICLLSQSYQRLSDVSSKTVKTLKRLPGYDTLRVILANKVILVEGPSDELVLKKIYLEKKNKLPEEDGIDIVVVRGSRI